LAKTNRLCYGFALNTVLKNSSVLVLLLLAGVADTLFLVTVLYLCRSSRQLIEQCESKISSLKLEAVTLRESLKKAQLEKEVAEQQQSNLSM